MSKRKKYEPAAFESGKSLLPPKVAETSANIFRSMMFSKAWHDLTNRQRNLYLTAKAMYYGTRKPEKDFPDIPAFRGDDKFFLNIGEAVKYGSYSKGMHWEFYKDIKALEDHGFIKTISNGRARKTKTIYQYSDGWKEWKPCE